MARTTQIVLQCENGHQHGLRIVESQHGRAAQFIGDEEKEEWIEEVPTDSYAYTHGGCCYRAAQDALADRDISHDGD